MAEEPSTRSGLSNPDDDWDHLLVREHRELLLGLLSVMHLIRESEEKLAAMLEQGEIGCPTHLYTGQEAIATGTCKALETQDLVFGAHRSHGSRGLCSRI